MKNLTSFIHIATLLDLKNSSNREYLIWGALLSIWAIIQIILFYESGVKTGVDSAFYLDNARSLLEFELPNGREVWYFSYAFFLAALLGLGLTLEGIVLIQVIISFFSIIFIYKIAKEIGGKNNNGLVAAALYIIWIKIQEWNMFIYTESLFTSCLIISFWFLLKVDKVKCFWLFLPLLLFTVFIRPTAFGFFVAVLAYVLFKTAKNSESRFFKAFLKICCFTFGIALITYMLESYELISSYAKAEIIIQIFI